MLFRKIYTEIEKYLEKREIIILLGARQVGKTSVMKYFFEKINTQKLWFNLDKHSDGEIFQNTENLINYIKLQNFDFDKKIYLFVDEFQYTKGSEIIFKNICDEFENIKIIASGSSSMDIKNKIQESLAGRKKIFYVYPLDLEEFIIWKENGNIKNQNIQIFKEIKGKLSIIAKKYYNYLYEFMVFGAYPKTLLEEEKTEVLDNIFDLYLKKDIIDFLNIKNISGFKKLLVYLAINNGKQANFTEISNFSDLDINTTKSYIEILEETFIIKQIKPYFSNANKEIKKAPKIYFIDNGVRNYFIKNFNKELDLRQDSGELFEGLIFQELLKNNIGELKYWRTKSGQEVDFIIDNIQNLIILEVKFKDKIKTSDFRGLKTLEKIYMEKIEKSLLVAKDRDNESISVFDLLNNI